MPPSNGWRGLQAILLASRAEHEADKARPVIECPRDGQALLVNVNGIKYCPYDGWRPDGHRTT